MEPRDYALSPADFDEDGHPVSTPSYNAYGDYVLPRPNATSARPIYGLPVRYTVEAFTSEPFAESVNAVYDRFLEAGFTYFDTAYVYVGLEEATRKALVSRHPRDSFTLATKVYPKVAPTAKAAKGQLGTSLKRLGTDYIDYFLLHSITDSDYGRYDQLGLWDFAAERKAAGVVRHVGFSFHGGPQVLDKVLTQHPEAEFVQLQLNYADWENPRVQARANYEVARKHGKPIVVMEPVKGGNLANPPANVRALFDAANPQASYAS